MDNSTKKLLLSIWVPPVRIQKIISVSDIVCVFASYLCNAITMFKYAAKVSQIRYHNSSIQTTANSCHPRLKEKIGQRINHTIGSTVSG